MITVRFQKENHLFTMNGHANYAEQGTDIVCAAASAIAISSLNGIIRFTNKDNYNLSIETGSIMFEIQIANEVIQKLLLNLKESLLQLERDYPNNIVVK